MLFFRSFLLVLVCTSTLFGQINLPDVIEPFQPIEVGCDCIVPQNGTIQFFWRTNPESRSIPVFDGKRLHVWAPPGTHWVENTVVTRTFKEITVFVPDPMFPTDPSKAKIEKIKVESSFSVDRYQKSYKVAGTTPTPPGPTPPGPGPVPPGPTPPVPTDEFAKLVQTWLKALGTGYSKEKALKIADNYEAVAGQAVATSSVPNLAAFVQKTKERNYQTLTTDEIAVWSAPFFRPLAEYQSKLAQDRNVSTSDIQGLAKLWRETAEAIKSAVY